tara:strand:+ start:15420 stop:16118 length:699 start_codon:yes stop_codon:yes gene_type:complete
MNLEEIKTMVKEELSRKRTSVLLAHPLNEANFGRVKNRIENEKVPFVMITAFRGGLSKGKNLERQKELESRVRSAGFSWTKMPGSGYVEDPEEEGGEPVNVKENSILIWDAPRGDLRQSNQDLFNLAISLAGDYEQDSFIHGKVVEADDEKEMFIKAYDKAGKPINEPWAGPWQNISVVDADDIYWSTIGSKKAKLTEILELTNALRVKSREDAMKKQHMLDAVKSALMRLE